MLIRCSTSTSTKYGVTAIRTPRGGGVRKTPSPRARSACVRDELTIPGLSGEHHNECDVFLCVRYRARSHVVGLVRALRDAASFLPLASICRHRVTGRLSPSDGPSSALGLLIGPSYVRRPQSAGAAATGDWGTGDGRRRTRQYRK
jgi:hypothetical protein